MTIQKRTNEFLKVPKESRHTRKKEKEEQEEMA